MRQSETERVRERVRQSERESERVCVTFYVSTRGGITVAVLLDFNISIHCLYI